MKRQRQFSQLICKYSLWLVAVTVGGNFVLSWFGKELLSDVTIAVISTFGGFVTCGYYALCFGRDNSKNKYGSGVSEHEN